LKLLAQNIQFHNLSGTAVGVYDSIERRIVLEGFPVELQFVEETTFEASTKATQAEEVELKLLGSSSVQRNGLTFAKEGCATELASARSDTAEPASFIASLNLAKFNTGAKALTHEADVLAEVYTLGSSKVEDKPAAIPLPLGVGELHLLQLW